MDDREWQTGINNPGEGNSSGADGPVENSSPDGWQNAGQGWNGYEGEGVNPQQNGGQYQNGNPGWRSVLLSAFFFILWLLREL